MLKLAHCRRVIKRTQQERHACKHQHFTQLYWSNSARLTLFGREQRQQQNEKQKQVTADLQQEGEALQGEALASHHCSADALRAVLELSQHDGHVVGSRQRHHHHPISLLGCCTACKKMRSGYCQIWLMSPRQMTDACMHELDWSGKHGCGMHSYIG